MSTDMACNVKTCLNCGRQWLGGDNKPETCSAGCQDQWLSWWFTLPSFLRQDMRRYRTAAEAVPDRPIDWVKEVSPGQA